MEELSRRLVAVLYHNRFWIIDGLLLYFILSGRPVPQDEEVNNAAYVKTWWTPLLITRTIVIAGFALGILIALLH